MLQTCFTSRFHRIEPHGREHPEERPGSARSADGELVPHELEQAAIDGSGTYRLAGERGTTPAVSIMAFGPPTAAGQQTFPPFDFADLAIDDNGRFDVILSTERPPGHTGDWWQLDREMRSLMLRCISDDWGRHRDPLVAIVRLDAGPRRRPTSADLSRRLETMATTVERMVTYGLRKVDDLRASGTVNELTLVDYTERGAIPGQWYHEGLFDLDHGQALIVEVTDLAPGSQFSVSLTDSLFCTIDWTHAQSSLNHHQAALDHDGAFRFVVAHDDPSVANWIDTTGHPSGVVQCRWTGQEHPPHVAARVVVLESIDDSPLHSASTLTAEQRSLTLRERAVGAQLRSLW